MLFLRGFENRTRARKKSPGVSSGASHFHIPQSEKSDRVVHVELDRMRRHFEAHHVLHLQLNIAVDEVVVEHAASLEERAVLVEVGEGFTQRAANRRDLLELLGGRSYRSLSMAAPGSILFVMPSMPAISIAAKARYGLAVGSGKRTSTRLAFGFAVHGIRHEAERLRAE